MGSGGISAGREGTEGRLLTVDDGGVRRCCAVELRRSTSGRPVACPSLVSHCGYDDDNSWRRAPDFSDGVPFPSSLPEPGGEVPPALPAEAGDVQWGHALMSPARTPCGATLAGLVAMTVMPWPDQSPASSSQLMATRTAGDIGHQGQPFSVKLRCRRLQSRFSKSVTWTHPSRTRHDDFKG